MPAITIKNFLGTRPILDPLLLGQTEAQVATNVRLLSGRLEPLRGTAILKALTKSFPQTLYRYGTSANETEYWLEFSSDTDVIGSPIAADDYGRVYWADGGTPKYAPNNLILSGASFPGGFYNLGVPKPHSTPSVSQSTWPVAKGTITATQIAGITPAAVLLVSVNGGAAVSVTLPGVITASGLASALSGVTGLTASVLGGQVVAQTVSATAASAILIQVKVANGADTILSVSNGSLAASEARVYVYTYVTAYGEEGPPSDASGVLSMTGTGSVTVSNLALPPGGAYNLAYKRIYRSSTVGAKAEYQFVAEIPVANTSYLDTKTQADLGEVLPSTDWVAPPSGLRGLKQLANGAAIGFVGNTIYLSEPNLPHAWPHQYPIEGQVVGIGIVRQSAVILTSGYPYLMSGADPQAMSLEKLELPQACVAKRSIVDTADGVLYASPDGLVSVGSGGMTLVTKDLLTRDQWQALNPSSIVAAVHDNRYHMVYTTTTGVRGVIVFDFSGQGAAMTSSNINASALVTAMFSDPRSDTLYMAQGTNVTRFNAGSPLSYVWRSKKFRAPFHMNFGKAQVIASAYPVTFRLYGDGLLRSTKIVTSNGIFHLPGGYRALDWDLELEGSVDVTQVTVSTSAEEIRSS
jgi:hypothetical protein